LQMLKIHIVSVIFLIVLDTINSEIKGNGDLVDLALLGPVYQKSDHERIPYRKEYEDLQSDESQELGSAICSGLHNKMEGIKSCMVDKIHHGINDEAVAEMQLKMGSSGAQLDEVGCVRYTDLKSVIETVNKEIEDENSVALLLGDAQFQIPLRNKQWKLTWKANAYRGEEILEFKPEFHDRGSKEFKDLENSIRDYVHEATQAEEKPTVRLNSVYQEEDDSFGYADYYGTESQTMTVVEFTLGITDPKKEFCASYKTMERYGHQAIMTDWKEKFGLSWIIVIDNPIPGNS